MITRVLAWTVVAAIGYGVWAFNNSYHSPWGFPVSPVLGKLPLSAPGCTEECHK